MAKGKPNDKSKLLNFVAKVYDPVAKAYKPIYELPDATNQVHGGVYLSDAVDSSANAATGVEAATPLAVKKANDNANKKLDKTTTSAQTVTSAVTFGGLVTGNQGFKGNLTGNVTGNASTATKLQTARQISVKAGSNGTAGTTTFDGSGNVAITIPTVDATAVVGTLPLNTIPKAAMERVITVANQAARFALTTTQVQLGDTVYQADTKIMYMVVDESKLNQAAGYQEYQAGTAAKLGTATVGANARPTYLNAGVATASTATVGANNKPVYMTGGTITASSFEVNKTVPADAKFTDTTYSVFKPATADAAGSTGLVSAPPAGANIKFLRGDGTWQVAGEVTGVKGNSESTYRKGQVNLTAANIGALPLAGGTLTGGLTTQAITPSANNTYSLGSSTNKWNTVYATTFNGNLTGNASTASTATTANKLNKTITLSGNVTSSAVSMNTDGNVTVATTIAANAINTSKIADNAVTNAKLADNVGTVYVGSSQPTEANVKIWVKV